MGLRQMSMSEKIELTPGGPRFSKLIQGYWRMGEWARSPQQHLAFLEQHLDLGVSTVDHANIYGQPACETLFGQVLKLAPALREKIEIVTKCGIELGDNSGRVAHYRSDRRYITETLELSLTRLGVDSVDVLLLHRPDLLMNVDEVAEAFLQLKQSGKVQHFGVSNYSASQFALLQSRLGAPLVTNQIEINPLNLTATEDGSLDFMQQLRVKPMAWSCLAGGRIFSEQTEHIRRLRVELENVRDELSADSIDQVLFAWVAALPAKPLPIVGSGNIERVVAAIESFSYTLTHEQWYRIWTASKGHGVA